MAPNFPHELTGLFGSYPAPFAQVGLAIRLSSTQLSSLEMWMESRRPYLWIILSLHDPGITYRTHRISAIWKGCDLSEIGKALAI